MRIDEVNLRILNLLIAHGRRSRVELARSMEMSESTVRERMTALERSNIILGYRAVVNEQSLGFGAKAIVRGRAPRPELAAVWQRLLDLNNVTHLWHTSGERPITMVVLAPTLGELASLLEVEIPGTGLEDLQADIASETLCDGRLILPSGPRGSGSPNGGAVAGRSPCLCSGGASDAFLAASPRKAAHAEPTLSSRP